MTQEQRTKRGRSTGIAALALAAGLLSPLALDAQTEQVIEVAIRDNAFVTKQVPLAMNVPIRIHIKNEDAIRHDFGSNIFRGTLTQVTHGGTVAYGQDVGGVFLDGGKDAMIHFTLHRPGQYEFKCSIHPTMKGELLLMSVGAV